MMRIKTIELMLIKKIRYEYEMKKPRAQLENVYKDGKPNSQLSVVEISNFNKIVPAFFLK